MALRECPACKNKLLQGEKYCAQCGLETRLVDEYLTPYMAPAVCNVLMVLGIGMIMASMIVLYLLIASAAYAERNMVTVVVLIVALFLSVSLAIGFVQMANATERRAKQKWESIRERTVIREIAEHAVRYENSEERKSAKERTAKYCVVCGNEVSVRDGFCGKCGAAVTKLCERCGAKHWRGLVSCEFCEEPFTPEDRAKRCEICGGLYDRAVSHCPFCGTKNMACDGEWEENEKKKGGDYNPSLAFVLCLFLGGIGMHKFYRGDLAAGLCYLVVTLIAVFTQLYVILLVEAVVWLVDLFTIYGEAKK